MIRIVQVKIWGNFEVFVCQTLSREYKLAKNWYGIVFFYLVFFQIEIVQGGWAVPMIQTVKPKPLLESLVRNSSSLEFGTQTLTQTRSIFEFSSNS